jgi:anthranilate synthase/aminodeoxychorismate synthase-like glutamine amidotransferase
MKILVIDNYDSFTYNLVQLIGGMGCQLIIRRNDEITTEEISAIKPDRILISPGPGKPEEAGISLSAIKDFGKNIPVLGVCLGHQAIGIVFGCKVIKAPYLMHGKVSVINNDGKTIFKGIGSRFEATRYHSLVIDRKTLSDELLISAETDDGIIMGVRHKKYPVEGIQFHPESFLTIKGEQIIRNWLNTDYEGEQR